MCLNQFIFLRNKQKPMVKLQVTTTIQYLKNRGVPLFLTTNYDTI